MLNIRRWRSIFAPLLLVLTVALLAGCSADQLPTQVDQSLAAAAAPTDAPGTALPEPPMATATASPTGTATGAPSDSATATATDSPTDTASSATGDATTNSSAGASSTTSSDWSAVTSSNTPTLSPNKPSHTSSGSSSSSKGTGHATATSTATATATASAPASAPASASATATSTAAPAPTASSTMTASSSSATYNFPLLPPGSALPSEAFCAAHVQKTAEVRSDNQAANSRVPTSAQLAQVSPWDASAGFDPRADQLRQQMTGHFTGTTDEILQWVACKWGVPVDVVRAEAVIESNWHQSQLGDQTNTQSECPPGTWNGSSCYQSYGILQIMYQYNTSAWPMSRDDTAFSAEYTYGVIRACYEGWETYLSSVSSSYKAGDLWGCIGRWYSGGWYDSGAVNYIGMVKSAENNQAWRQSGF